MTRESAPSKVILRQKPTLRQVAEVAGVCPSTVSAVLNRSPRARAYSDETKEKILAAARELGYVPNPLARSLKKNRTNLLGVVLFCQHSTYFVSMLQGVEEQSHALGFEIITADMRRDANRLERCLHLVTAWRVEGVLLMIGSHPVNRSLLSSVRDAGTPCVEIGSPNSDYPASYVSFDNFRAGQLIAEHLVSLGHAEIGVLAGSPENLDSERRLAGIRSVLGKRGIDLVDRRVIKASDNRFELSAGYHAAGRLLEEHPEVTAIVSINDAMAIGAIRRIRESGRDVPGDVSVAGFDDLCLDDITDHDNRLGAYINPSLTTIRAPLHDVGKAAASVLAEMVNGGESEERKRIEFAPELVVRESTGPVKVADRRKTLATKAASTTGEGKGR